MVFCRFIISCTVANFLLKMRCVFSSKRLIMFFASLVFPVPAWPIIKMLAYSLAVEVNSISDAFFSKYVILCMILFDSLSMKVFVNNVY